MSMNYAQITDYLYSIPKFTHEPSLEPARALLLMLGSPKQDKKIIHVAGTNGKGSVCAYLSSVLIKAGCRTGLFTSPHLVDIEERIRIDGVNVSKELFAESFHAVRECEEKLEERYGKFSFFEYLFGMAMYCFDKTGVEYIILETGLGGRLDATNAIDNPVMTIITPVSLDHMAVLGNTIELIAGEKAGIIKKDVPVVYWGSDEKVAGVIRDTAGVKGAPAFEMTSKNYEILEVNDKSVDFLAQNMYHGNDKYRVPFLAVYQAENALLAIEALWILSDKDKRITYDAVYAGIEATCWAGRFEEVAPGIVVDGAHNEAGVLSFIEAVATRDKKRLHGKKYLLFTVMKDKDYHRMIELICANIDFDKVIVTRSGGTRGLNAEKIRSEFADFKDTPVVVIEDFKEALAYGRGLIDGSDVAAEDTLFCVGSLYLVGDVLKEAGGRK